VVTGGLSSWKRESTEAALKEEEEEEEEEKTKNEILHTKIRVVIRFY
jgi:hypothetical protein